MISKQTAYDIAIAWQEIERCEQLLIDVDKQTAQSFERVDIRDHFGRRVDGLQLGVPSGENGHRLFNLPWALARPVIETHMAASRARIKVLCEKARQELKGDANGE